MDEKPARSKCPIIWAVDKDDPKACTPCESLRVSYKDPRFGDVLTEDVFVDSRDSLLGGGSLLLVNAAGVSALQQKSSREHRWIDSTQAAMKSCRRDYLREQRYLLDELGRLSQIAPKAAEKDIHELMEHAMKSAEAAAEDPATVVKQAEIEFLSESVGGPKIMPQDEELLDKLNSIGLSKEDELCYRILLQRIRADTKPLRKKRTHLQKLVEAVEGNNVQESGSLNKLIETMMKVAAEGDASLRDIMDALLSRAASNETRQAIEDAVTNRLRQRYETAFLRHFEIEPLCWKWRESLATHEVRCARHLLLTEELEAAKCDLKKHELNEREWKQEAEEQKAAAGRLEVRQEEEPIAKVMERIMDKLPEASQAKIKEEQHQVQVSRRRAHKLKEELNTVESKVETFEVRQQEIGTRAEAAQNTIKMSQDEVVTSEEMVQQAEEVIRRASVQESRVRAHREELEDEAAASQKRPPKKDDSRKLELSVELARERHEELKSKAARLEEKQREYEARFDNAESAWKVKREEDAAAALLEAQNAAEERARQAAADSEMLLGHFEGASGQDPLMLDYFDRICLPEYSEIPRFSLLHADNHARNRRVGKMRETQNEEQAEKVFAQMKASESEAALPSSGPRSQVPLSFRHPEDLKVRLVGAQRNVGRVENGLAMSGLHGMQVAAELRELGRQLSASAMQTSGIHVDVPRELVDFLGGGGLPVCSIRDQLAHSLEQHEASVSRAEEVWRQAEAGCIWGAPAAELELEQAECARCEEDLTEAARRLYLTSMHAAREGPDAVVPLAEGCCLRWSAREKELVEAAVVRGNTWPRILRTASTLAQEQEKQSKLKKHLRAEERRRSLLHGEKTAPPEARRALAAMRMATSTTSRLSSNFLE